MRPLFKDFAFKDWVYFGTLLLGGLVTVTTIYNTALAEREANKRYSKENRKLIYEKTDALKDLINDNKKEIRHNRRILYDILKRVK